MSAEGRKLQLVLVFSFGVNVAFAGVWATRTLFARTARVEPGPTAGGDALIWCPLHRELGVDPAQWRRIEPRLREFHTNVTAKRSEVAALRAEMLEMLAAEVPDSQRVQAKQEEILTSQGQIQAMVVTHLLAEKQLLDPDQRSKLFKMIQSCSQCPQSGGVLDGSEPARCNGNSGNGVGSR
jgi:Spy/CpxP family protein refolding chaperone